MVVIDCCKFTWLTFGLCFLIIDCMSLSDWWMLITIIVAICKWMLITIILFHCFVCWYVATSFSNIIKIDALDSIFQLVLAATINSKNHNNEVLSDLLISFLAALFTTEKEKKIDPLVTFRINNASKNLTIILPCW